MIIVYVKYGNAAWLIFPMCPFNVSSRPRTWLRSVTFKPSWRTPSRRSRRFKKRWVFLVAWLPCCFVALLMLFTCKKMMKKMLGFKLWNPHIMNSCSGPPPPVWKWWPKMTLHIHLHRWSWLMSRQRMSLTNWRTTHSLHLWKCFHPSRMFMNIVLFHLHSSPLWQKDRICSFFLHDAQGIGFWWIFFADLSIIRSVIAFYAWISNCCHLLRWS